MKCRVCGKQQAECRRTPTSLGVNPQITILAIAERSAEWLVENFAKVAG